MEGRGGEVREEERREDGRKGGVGGRTVLISGQSSPLT